MSQDLKDGGGGVSFNSSSKGIEKKRLKEPRSKMRAPIKSFVYVEEGEVEAINPYTNERNVPFTLGPTQFMGEISRLNGGVG